ncbi:MAG: hypothetical protein B7Y07_02265 [Halothiobacillus sp. 24-54-40]|jgi:hypothetical protein|nr:MAG: hypothetical protein B7Y58_01870 [Halothiobacillus sp. 35-54-62]OYZ87971.1 MAG: hypothetical protein B7Y07_02265 [Halothiobacillus sp. 24-54-40]OZA81411.1 MAG: hypothetical protein B7X64_01490 [Halothiobacillus sp. 39-53-45]
MHSINNPINNPIKPARSLHWAALHEDIRQKFAHNTNRRTGRSKSIHRYRLFLGTVLKFKLF